MYRNGYHTVIDTRHVGLEYTGFSERTHVQEREREHAFEFLLRTAFAHTPILPLACFYVRMCIF